MWHAADVAEKIRHAKGYQFKGPGIGAPQFSWSTFKPLRDAYIQRLNGIYDRNVDKEGVEQHHGTARVVSPSAVEVTRPDGSTYTLNTDRVCVATGGRPTVPSEDEIPGASLGIDSDGFFDLAEQPRRVAVVGAGYIAVELAGVLHTLGSEVTMLIRGETVLRTFDPTLGETLTNWMKHTGINFRHGSKVKKVEARASVEYSTASTRRDITAPSSESNNRDKKAGRDPRRYCWRPWAPVLRPQLLLLFMTVQRFIISR